MTDAAYEKINTRARELLNARPRPTTQAVADAILSEIAEEFAVPEWLRDAFVERLRPALMTLVGSARAKLIRELEEEATRAYFARPIPSAESPAIADPAPRAPTPASALGAGMNGQSSRDPQTGLAAVPAPESGAHPDHEDHPRPGAPTPASGGHGLLEDQADYAALPESGRADGDHDAGENHDSVVAPSAPEAIGHAESNAPSHPGSAARLRTEPIHTSPPAPVSPLSLRAEVLDGWRPLRDELLYVPEYPGVTYGSATAVQRQRAMTYYHAVGMGWVGKARRMRALDEAVKQAGFDTLDELLDNRSLAIGRQS